MKLSYVQDENVFKFDTKIFTNEAIQKEQGPKPVITSTESKHSV